MIHFCWVDEKEIFSIEKHSKSDENIFDMKIVHSEGLPAKAEITISFLSDAEKRKSHCVIVYDDGNDARFCLFRGKLENSTKKQDGPFITISFVACSEIEKDKQKFVEILKKEKFYDELIYGKNPKADELIAATNFVFYWDRVTGECKMSDLFKGNKSFEINFQNFFEGSLKSRSETPVIKVEMQIEAQWIQHLSGFVNLFHFIRHRFKEGYVNSYTGKSLKRAWPKSGETFGRSGYRVVYSEIKEIEPPFCSLFKRKPGSFAISVPVRKRGQTGEQEISHKQMLAKRTWFDGELLAMWTFKQKRKETLSFALESSLQVPNDTLCETKTAFIRLQKIVQIDDIPFWYPMAFYKKGDNVRCSNGIYSAIKEHYACRSFDQDKDKWKKEKNICPSVHSSFFNTDKGVEIFELVVERARAILDRGARIFKISFSGDPESLAQITLDDQVSIVDKRIPGGKAVGKVSSYKFVADGKKIYVEIEVTCSVGSKSAKKQKRQEGESYVDKTYSQQDWQVVENSSAKTLSGIEYYSYRNQTPTDPYADLQFFKEYQMIKNILLSNPPEKQEEALEQISNGVWNDNVNQIDTNILKQIDTKIRVDMQKLSSSETMPHSIKAEIFSVYEPKQQVKL
ncbi:hypothetical protein [Candidatus Hydrogenosomobacter endosymbioticus]|uniref:Uncharacterized protein n=1 Tax=Candidatus Hydrogenosomobacter endosymbioticus TaxID=2558174 RepID=A0ABM7V857_9PROT|nr:hypothetical protein [Candidatus Hydrogenosomobacter endosymbioticus]BDB95918.1 hypothetical protein HYD_0510 [Candidatus Hydrogenosomobacter endosymbioticus]